ncbi:SH3 domain-containing protein [Bacillus sp. Marseille-P3800]|uniref:SH3 domain-containing protein n=1 Tax=Bacillus sp. Marseille-P3800 TaxID=2014782 RepID=UPI000C07ED0F|nr:SH3 domain-containing protein [Bacillus sp. Marseille-P3800]
MALDNKIVIDLTKKKNDKHINPYSDIDLEIKRVSDNWNRIADSIISSSRTEAVSPGLMSVASALKDQNLDYLESQISIIQHMTKSMANSIHSVPSNQVLLDSIASFYSSLDFRPYEAFIHTMKAAMIEMNEINLNTIQDRRLRNIFSYYEEREKNDRTVTKLHIQEQVLEIIGDIKDFANIGDFIDQGFNKIEALKVTKPAKMLNTISFLKFVWDSVLWMFNILCALIISVSPDNHERIESIQADFEEFINIESADTLIDVKAKAVTHEMLVREGNKKKSKVIGYVEEGDVVLLAEKKRNWSKVGFYNDNGSLVEGWVLTRYLEEING